MIVRGISPLPFACGGRLGEGSCVGRRGRGPSSDRSRVSLGLREGVGAMASLRCPARMMAIVEQLVSTSAMSSEMMTIAIPLGQLAQDGVDGELASDVDTDGGSVEDEDGGVDGEPLGQDDLCWLPPERVLTAPAGRGDDAEALDPAFLLGPMASFVDEAEVVREGVHLRDRDVLSDGAREEEASVSRSSGT